MGHGLQFQTGYTFSKLLDVNSELFAGCSTIGGNTAPYYYISNALPNLSYGKAAFDHKHAYKFSVTYELPFLKSQKGFAGHALGGWALGSFYQLYSGHPIDVYNGNSAFPGNALDANGIPENLGGDYNLDGVLNDHPVFLGSSLSSVYSGGNPANGIFIDNNPIGCGFPGQASSAAATAACNAALVGGPTSTLFGNPPYPTSGSLFNRYGTLGRDVFHGPRFQQLDLGMSKTFKITETMKLDFRVSAQNLANHPNFDCVDANLSDSTFGTAQCDLPFGTGAPTSRIMSVGLRLAF